VDSGPSASVLIDSDQGQVGSSTLFALLLPAETVEFSVSCASEKSVPFGRCKSENRTFGVPAVANTDLAIRQARHLDAVAVSETQRTLNPVKA
jgi:hypothetical protein